MRRELKHITRQVLQGSMGLQWIVEDNGRNPAQKRHAISVFTTNEAYLYKASMPSTLTRLMYILIIL